jgi:hypothetical protein
MQFLYHMRQPDMQGTVLYPLNALKAIYPEIYARQIAKYQDHPDRVGLPSKVIPKLNCLWNDVIQCSPVHPHLFYLALQKRGLRVNSATEFFQIPVSAVGANPLAVFEDSPDDDLTAPFPDQAVTLLTKETYREISAVPEATLRWYDRLAQQGNQVFGHFVGVPHILIQGPVDVSAARVIRWS